MAITQTFSLIIVDEAARGGMGREGEGEGKGREGKGEGEGREVEGGRGGSKRVVWTY
jgi:hypothetical protein